MESHYQMPNRTIAFIDLPANALPAQNPSDAYRTLIAIAFAQALKPKFIDISGLIRKSVFIPPLLDIRVQKLADSEMRSYQDVFAALCCASLDVLMASRVSMAHVSQNVEVPFAARPGQDTYYKSISGSISKSRICLAEASTGIGKSRAIVAAALTASLGKKKPVVVAAPTLAILGGSLWKELEYLQQHGLGAQCRARFYPGASEFVDRDRLTNYFEDAKILGEPIDAAVKEWLDNKCPVLHETPLTRAMEKSGHKLHYMMSDLRELATELDPSDFAYKRSEIGNEPIIAILEAVRMDAVDADIIFCTHAMLAMGKISAWEWFPKPSVLFIDEAHLFEGIVSSTTSSNLSLFSFRHSVRMLCQEQSLGSGSVAAKLETSLLDLIESCKSIDKGGESTSIDGKSIRDSNSTFVGMLRKTSELLNSKTLATLPRIKDARACLQVALDAIASVPNAYCRVTYSPDRRFPSLLVGKRNIGGLLGSIWSDAEGGAVLASATLSVPDEFGNSKFDYIAGLLALPISSLDTPNPVVASWVTSIPAIHAPTNPDLITRPHKSIRTQDIEADWLEHLSEQVVCVSELAKGGTLVLMTSYAQIEAMAQIMGAIGLENRLIVQNADEKFQACERRFRSAYAMGLRPILLGLGVAWTGVDLTDKSVPEKDDFLLTELVIGCLPIGLNRSSTMAARIESKGVNPIVKEALMTLLQGFGRLVRSENATEKNIWIMDGRLWTQWPGMQSLQKSARRIMERYQKQTQF